MCVCVCVCYYYTLSLALLGSSFLSPLQYWDQLEFLLSLLFCFCSFLTTKKTASMHTQSWERGREREKENTRESWFFLSPRILENWSTQDQATAESASQSNVLPLDQNTHISLFLSLNFPFSLSLSLSLSFLFVRRRVLSPPSYTLPHCPLHFSSPTQARHSSSKEEQRIHLLFSSLSISFSLSPSLDPPMYLSFSLSLSFYVKNEWHQWWPLHSPSLSLSLSLSRLYGTFHACSPAEEHTLWSFLFLTRTQI